MSDSEELLRLQKEIDDLKRRINELERTHYYIAKGREVAPHETCPVCGKEYWYSLTDDPETSGIRYCGCPGPQ